MATSTALTKKVFTSVMHDFIDQIAQIFDSECHGHKSSQAFPQRFCIGSAQCFLAINHWNWLILSHSNPSRTNLSLRSRSSAELLTTLKLEAQPDASSSVVLVLGPFYVPKALKDPSDELKFQVFLYGEGKCPDNTFDDPLSPITLLDL